MKLTTLKYEAIAHEQCKQNVFYLTELRLPDLWKTYDRLLSNNNILRSCLCFLWSGWRLNFRVRLLSLCLCCSGRCEKMKMGASLHLTHPKSHTYYSAVQAGVEDIYTLIGKNHFHVDLLATGAVTSCKTLCLDCSLIQFESHPKHEQIMTSELHQLARELMRVWIYAHKY